jgi:hypothetical protein
LRAVLNAREQVPKATVAAPHAVGLFVATLIGGRLAWRLTFHGLTSGAVSAHVHIGKRSQAGPTAAKLCGPCASGAQGTARVTGASASAFRSGKAYVDVHTAKNPRGEIRGQVTVGRDVATLQILSPKDGDTLSLPAPVSYSVHGFLLGESQGRILAFVRGYSGIPRLDLRLSGPGLAYLPQNPLLTGHRDVTFALAQPDGVILPNPEAQVTVHDLTLQGGR